MFEDMFILSAALLCGAGCRDCMFCPCAGWLLAWFSMVGLRVEKKGKIKRLKIKRIKKESKRYVACFSPHIPPFFHLTTGKKKASSFSKTKKVGLFVTFPNEKKVHSSFIKYAPNYYCGRRINIYEPVTSGNVGLRKMSYVWGG